MLKPLLVLTMALGAQGLFAQAPIGVRGVMQETWPTAASGTLQDGWGGTAYLVLDNGECLVGVVWGTDGTTAWHGAVGIGKGGRYTLAFNPKPGVGFQDTFTIESTNSAFPMPPGRIGLNGNQGSAKIVAGTGRFQNAEGTFLVRGSWMDVPVGLPNGLLAVCNCDISGTISKVLPAP